MDPGVRGGQASPGVLVDLRRQTRLIKVEIATPQLGPAVAISRAGEGGSLKVELLAKSASLASGGRATRVRVGKLVRWYLRTGKVAFSVPLNSRARGALRRYRRLPLSARIVIKPVTGFAVTVTRSVVLHA